MATAGFLVAVCSTAKLKEPLTEDTVFLTVS